MVMGRLVEGLLMHRGIREDPKTSIAGSTCRVTTIQPSLS